MEDTWLGPWRCLLVGEPANPAASASFLAAARDLKKRMDAAKQGRAEWANPTKSGPCVDLELVRLLLQGAHSLPDGALESAVAELLGWSPEVAGSAADLREESGRNRTRGRGGRDVRSDSGSENESGEESGPEGLELRQAKLVVRLADELRRVASEADVSDGDGDVSTAKVGKRGKGSGKVSRGVKREEDTNGRSGERLPVVLVLDSDLQVRAGSDLVTWLSSFARIRGAHYWIYVQGLLTVLRKGCKNSLRALRKVDEYNFWSEGLSRCLSWRLKKGTCGHRSDCILGKVQTLKLQTILKQPQKPSFSRDPFHPSNKHRN